MHFHGKQLLSLTWQNKAVTRKRWPFTAGFLPVLELDIHPKLVQYIKLAETATGLGTENVRAPRLAIEGHERKKVLGIIHKAIENRPELPVGSWGVEVEVDVTGVS